MPTSTRPRPPLPDLPCACETLRRAAMLVTQLYSAEMGRDMEPSQFSLLSALSQMRGASQASLGRALGLDKTTMSRNLRLMQSNGWIKPVKADDGRQRGYRLTPAGAKMHAAGKASWMRTQERLRAELGDGDWEAMFEVIGRVAEATGALSNQPDGAS